MIVESQATLDLFRTPGRCEYSGDYCPNGRDPSHIFPTGLGGINRVDAPWNLCSLSRKWHQASHARNVPNRIDLMHIAAGREGCTVEDIKAAYNLINRLDGKASQEQRAVVVAAAELTPRARQMVEAALQSMEGKP